MNRPYRDDISPLGREDVDGIDIEEDKLLEDLRTVPGSGTLSPGPTFEADVTFVEDDAGFGAPFGVT